MSSMDCRAESQAVWPLDLIQMPRLFYNGPSIQTDRKPPDSLIRIVHGIPFHLSALWDANRS